MFSTANKRRKVDSDSEDGDELSEMRKNAIESMKRRRQGVNNDFNPRTEPRSKEKPSDHTPIELEII